MQDDLIALKFVNSDAKPKTVTLHCDEDSIAPIMAWYGAYHAGDRYAVYADDRKLAKDQNGELVAQAIRATPPKPDRLNGEGA